MKKTLFITALLSTTIYAQTISLVCEYSQLNYTIDLTLDEKNKSVIFSESFRVPATFTSNAIYFYREMIDETYFYKLNRNNGSLAFPQNSRHIS